MSGCSYLKTGVGVGVGVHVSGFFPGTKHGFSGVSSFSQENKSRSKLLSVLNLDLKETSMDSSDYSSQALTACPSPAKTSSMVRWCEKKSTQNMLEIRSAQHLVDSLMNAGDLLVVIDFYSPGCGGCKSLHPKICQLAESNPEVLFLKVNQDELRTMCHSLNVHVLPFFRFYRGADGRLCSFSCTISTISKFKKAMAKHGSKRCSFGPPKGLDEKELLAMASAGELPMAMSSKLPLSQNEIKVQDLLTPSARFSSLVYFSETEEQQPKAIL
ncbi:PREDICTED: thioredoxin-like 1-2, chloroplastic [Tarenaya hassleriana]|uniref:thioredoxin-like 1-2, chloroplastic n=1 Tax=Tarenaya hassleriana TaxID=28532 RepID=UPI00053C4DB0|nr:PREDICTED: thioredoxin-like 1-2, chloroplastic [Tarenaya hassleriana]